MSYESGLAKNEEKVYPEVFEVMKKIDEVWMDMPLLPKGDLDDKMELVYDGFYKLLKDIQAKVKELDEEKLAKWVASNK
jgi:hypothetical protein